jgi:hypothetical protein
MGSRALQLQAETTEELRQGAAGSAEQPIQRKLGFEVEVKLDLAKGVLANENSPLLDTGYEARPGRITKGQTILSGDGWKLTPDGGEGNWYIEFITDAVDETAQPARLPAIMRNLSRYVTDTFGDLEAGTYKQLPGTFVAGRHAQQRNYSLDGNMHITGGIRPDRIIDLLRTIQTWKGGDKVQNVDKGTRRNLKTATDAADLTAGDASYKGLVALLGTYISGQWRLLASAPRDLKESLTAHRHDDEVYGKLDYCIDENDIREFIQTGAVTDRKTLGYIDERFDTRGEFYEALQQFIKANALSTAKLVVPVLSRSSLAKLRSKATIADDTVFLRDVMAASGLGWDRRDRKLFPLGLNAPDDSARTIERHPDITISEWVNGILGGTNLTFSDRQFGFEDVGPATGQRFFCLCNTYEQGAVLEIRALDAAIPPDRWEDFATAIVAVYRTLNA